MVMDREKWFHSKIDGLYYCMSKRTSSKLFVVASYDPFIGYKVKRLVKLPGPEIVKEIAENEPLKLCLILVAAKELREKGVKSAKQVRS
jgi:hypothetical protein